MSQLKQFLHSERLEIKPSLGDGHCLLYSVCASYNNQLSQLLPLNKEDLINIIDKELQDHSELYLGFYTKSREEFFSELSNYIKHKRYNSDICDIIPIVIANALKLKLKILNEKRHDSFETTIVEPFSASHTGVLFIHRKGDHYNGVVYRIYPRTVQSALHPPSARRVSCSAGTTLAPRPTRVRPSSSSARADPTHCPSRVRPPSSSTWANPAHCPTRVRPPSSSTRADPAHCPTRAGPTRADIPSSSTRAYPAHCPTRVRHPSSFTRADSAHLPTRAGPTRVCPSSSSARDYREFNELLETNGYLQHVKSSTHTSGNTLDLIITPANSNFLCKVYAQHHSYLTTMP